MKTGALKKIFSILLLVATLGCANGQGFTPNAPSSHKAGLSGRSLHQSPSEVLAEMCTLPFHGGLVWDGLEIPRAGKQNPHLTKFTFESTGPDREPFGRIHFYQNCPFIKGGVSTFGGPEDKTIGVGERGAISGEALREMNNPLNPSRSDAVKRSEKYYYSAMRIAYTKGSLDEWQSAHLLVVNPQNQKAVVVRVVDWGPHPRLKNRIIDVSPQTLKDLGAETDEELLVAFAPEQTPLGPLQ